MLFLGGVVCVWFFRCVCVCVDVWERGGGGVCVVCVLCVCVVLGWLGVCCSPRHRVFLVIRPNPILHFAPFLSTHFFPCLNPIFKNGSFSSVVALVSVTLLDSNPRPSSEKRSNLAPTPSSFLPRADFDN